PTGYTQCGALGFVDTSTLNTPTGPCTPAAECQQQGTNSTTGYWGHYPNFTDAFHYSDHPNQWMVEYWHFKVGTFGAGNGLVQAWIAPVGQPLKQFINMPNFNFSQDPGCPTNTSAECFYNM